MAESQYIYTVRIGGILYACHDVYACPWLGEAGIPASGRGGYREAAGAAAAAAA
jgi:hypothetical protein